MAKEKIKKTVFLVVLILVLVVVGVFAVKALMPGGDDNKGPVYTTEAVTRGDLKVGVSATGNVNPGYGSGIMLDYNEQLRNIQFKIEEILVKSGDKVQAGDPLVILSAPELDKMVKDAREAYEVERKSLASLLNVPESEVDYASPDNGITIFAPFDGKINIPSGTDNKLKIGATLESGSYICQVVDDSKLQMTVNLVASEMNSIKDDAKAIVRFGSSTYMVEAKVLDINRNPVAVQGDSLIIDGGMGSTGSDMMFVYQVLIEVDNPGLIAPGMYASVGFFPGNEKFTGAIPDNTLWCKYLAQVEQYSQEQNVVSTIKGVVTDVKAKKNQNVKAGDPILVISGQEVREALEQRIASYREKRNAYENLQGQSGKLVVSAMSSGMISNIEGKVGDSVTTGQYFGNIMSSENMTMEVKVSDMDVVLVASGAPVDITLDSLPGQEFTGKVEFVSGNAQGGKFTVYITFSGSEDMREGMQARAYIKSGEAKDVLIVPTEAVFKEDGVYKVEVMGEDGTVTVKNIEIGLMSDISTEVRSGLEEGELVVTGSTADLLPNNGSGNSNNNGILPQQPNGNEGMDGGMGSGDIMVEEMPMPME